MFSFSIRSVVSNFELDSPKTFQMDRRWITGCTGFTTDHEKGVQDFLAFLRTRYAEDEEILCPCRRCLNNSTGTIERIGVHLLVSGMATTYTRWIHHGEALEDMVDDDANVQDYAILPDAEGDVDNAAPRDGGDQEMVQENQYISGMEEDEGPGDDGMSELIADLGKGQVLGEKMYEFVKEHLNRKVSPTSSYAQFTFVVKLLHIKSFSRMSNVAFNATMNLLQKGFPEACLPDSFRCGNEVHTFHGTRL